MIAGRWWNSPLWSVGFEFCLHMAVDTGWEWHRQRNSAKQDRPAIGVPPPLPRGIEIIVGLNYQFDEFASACSAREFYSFHIELDGFLSGSRKIRTPTPEQMAGRLDARKEKCSSVCEMGGGV